jgi:uncharacterized protein with von Willebrand factor type A (vWA) domain
MSSSIRELRPAVAARVALLVAAMRAGGVRLGVGDLLRAQRALAPVDASSRADSHRALRAALCARRADRELFDAAFEAVFGGVPGPGPRVAAAERRDAPPRACARRPHTSIASRPAARSRHRRGGLE